MKITANAGRYGFDIVVESEKTVITEDVSKFSKEGYSVDESFFEQFINAAFEVSRFNNVPDVETVKKIFDAFLNKDEQEEFVELISEVNQ